MEDAMMINKASFERGFGYGMIYKTESIDLNDKKSYFHRDPSKSEELKKTIDIDGLPMPGTIIKKNDPYYW
jgi:DNA-directed RNA polymerase I subunit RPA2